MPRIHLLELLERILSCIPVNNSNAHLVSVSWNTFLNSVLLNKTKKLQKLYRGICLEKSPNNLYTRKTLIRYYLVKYEREWLLELPRRMVSKCGVQVEEIDNEFLQTLNDDSKAFGKVRYFMLKYASLPVIEYYGW